MHIMQFIDSAVCSNKPCGSRGKRVVLGIDRIDEPFAKQLLAGKGWDFLLISPAWTAASQQHRAAAEEL